MTNVPEHTPSTQGEAEQDLDVFAAKIIEGVGRPLTPEERMSFIAGHAVGSARLTRELEAAQNKIEGLESLAEVRRNNYMAAEAELEAARQQRDAAMAVADAALRYYRARGSLSATEEAGALVTLTNALTVYDAQQSRQEQAGV